eukprot:894789-Alexandrium_andersonii.AAC.1
MSASLVGSEMCIRDRSWPRCYLEPQMPTVCDRQRAGKAEPGGLPRLGRCLTTSNRPPKHRATP